MEVGKVQDCIKFEEDLSTRAYICTYVARVGEQVLRSTSP